MLSQKLEDLAMAVGDMCGQMATGRTVDPARLTTVQRLLVCYAEKAREMESLTVPLHARRSGQARRQFGNLGPLGDDDKVVDLDRFRDGRHPAAGGGGAA